MPIRRSVTEVARHFTEYINRVAYRGERFTLMRGGKPVAELRPVPSGVRLGELPEILAGLPHLSAEDRGTFEDDLNEARDELVKAPITDALGR
ncbi:MAG: hypothetical protein WD273_12530 [Trueperaceae bacterium]